jgi:hypothetical protein
MQKSIEDDKPSKTVTNFINPLLQAKVKPLHPEETPVFITEAMEAEALARGDTSYSEPPLFITRTNKNTNK